MAEEKYNRLTIIRVLPKIPKTKRKCIAKCDCGTIKEYLYGSVKSGNTKSCGCLKLEKCIENGRNNKTHGLSSSSFYGCYIRMVDRCTNPSCDRYLDYGGRGITVCEEWLKCPSNFLKDMGERPSGKHTIERIDNNKGYYRDNCRWATYKEQNNNKRDYKNKSKYGVGIYKQNNRFIAMISDTYLGSYITPEQAQEAREECINA